AQRPRIDDASGQALRSTLVEAVGNRAFVVALKKLELHVSELAGQIPQSPVDVVQGERAVDVRLSCTQQVQVRTVDHQDLEAGGHGIRRSPAVPLAGPQLASARPTSPTPPAARWR